MTRYLSLWIIVVGVCFALSTTAYAQHDHEQLGIETQEHTHAGDASTMSEDADHELADEHEHAEENEHATGHDHATGHGQAADNLAPIRYLGRFHPLVVHFPIALVLAATLGEIISIVRKRNTISEATFFCLVLATLGAVIAAPLGWADALGAVYESTFASIRVVTIHRWLGTSTAVLAVVTLLLAVRARRGATLRQLWVYRGALFVTAVLVDLAGHFGAALVFGLDYYKP